VQLSEVVRSIKKSKEFSPRGVWFRSAKVAIRTVAAARGMHIARIFLPR